MKLRSLLLGLCSAGVFLAAHGLSPSSARSAERVNLIVGGPISLSISVDSFETFADTGEIPTDLKIFASLASDRALATLRQALQQRFQISVVKVDQIAYSPIGRALLKQLGQLIGKTPQQEGSKGLRAAAIGAAANADETGWSALDVLRQYPTSSIDIRVSSLLDLQKQLALYLNYNQAAVEAIQNASEQAARLEANAGTADGSALPDISQPGPYRPTKQLLNISDPSLQQTVEGLSVNFKFDADLYLPQGLNEPAPIIAMSHGFGSQKENYTYIAEHLASHGFAVVIPNHVGSNLDYRQAFLQNRLTTLLSPVEYLNRPQAISLSIDELERLVDSNPTWAQRLDLDRIGIFGNSLGGATALSVAGAELNFARLNQACSASTIQLDTPLVLQCRALYLPPIDYRLHDPRIKALVTGHQLSNALFGPEEIGKITIPTLMLSGSGDLVTPTVLHQIHPFIWLNTPQKYLALLTPGTHFSTSVDGAEGAQQFPKIIWGENQSFGRRYNKSLATAFFQQYLRGEESYGAYLTPAYARQLSGDAPMQLYLLRDLQPEQLTQAYGGEPPVAIIPEALSGNAIAETMTNAKESVLSEIQRTGVLKVAIRRDAVPLGYVDDQGTWTGYCTDFANRFSQHLSQTLGFTQAIEVAELPSNLSNRFDLVREGTVHLECGPNSIRSDEPQIRFSKAFFVTGTQFLANPTSNFNPALPLQGQKVGVLENTTTASLVQRQYPQAEIVKFSGDRGRTLGVQAVINGEVDAFASDRILLEGELQQQEQTSGRYTFSPDQPLSCDFYGLALPQADQSWSETVNEFIDSSTVKRIGARWFGDFLSEGEVVQDLEYCLNR